MRIIIAILVLVGIAEAQSKPYSRWISAVTAADGSAFSVPAASFTTGQQVGALMRFPNAKCRDGRAARLTSILIPDTADNDISWTMVFWRETPAGTFASGSVPDPNDDQLPKVLPFITTEITDRERFNDNGYASLSSASSGVFASVDLSGVPQLYAILRAKGSATTEAGGIVPQIEITCY